MKPPVEIVVDDDNSTKQRTSEMAGLRIVRFLRKRESVVFKNGQRISSNTVYVT